MLSLQALFDEWFIGIYNVVYTSTPVLVLGFLEQVFPVQWELQFPLSDRHFSPTNTCLISSPFVS